MDLDKVSSQPLHRKLWSMSATTRLSHLEAEGQTFLPPYLCDTSLQAALQERDAEPLATQAVLDKELPISGKQFFGEGCSCEFLEANAAETLE